MGMMRKVYLDSCIAIYLVEEHSVYCPGIEATLAIDAVNKYI
jgi:hypothetical protein